MMTDIDISPEAVVRLCTSMRIGHSSTVDAERMIRALSAALTQSRAETAAAYERAIAECQHISSGYETSGDFSREATAELCGDRIRNIATPDQSAALAAIVSDAEARGREAGMREAADMVNWTQYDRDTRDYFKQRILAAIPKGGV